MLSEFQYSLRAGNSHQIFQIFAFMKNYLELTIYFDPILPNIYPTSFSGSLAQGFREQY